MPATPPSPPDLRHPGAVPAGRGRISPRRGCLRWHTATRRQTTRDRILAGVA
ncbi:hypothetical protein [Ideonella livida]|uniref:Uncharacterized protein n=1 Tax=Ideonella livida TaxID=2707176 RepID=A0A7C9TIY5_9BURK|nr:hypothetical protein [Ideonella livida]NDY90205.1 hypothetical protein [Ideonella livida]